MPPSTQPSSLCPGTRLYLASLAERIEVLEDGHVADAIAHRLYIRRLKTVLKFHSDLVLFDQLGTFRVVRELLEQRHFDRHGGFPGVAGTRAGEVAAALFVRLGHTKAR